MNPLDIISPQLKEQSTKQDTLSKLDDPDLTLKQLSNMYNEHDDQKMREAIAKKIESRRSEHKLKALITRSKK